LISEFLQITVPKGFLPAIKIPGNIAHCCRLGCEVRRKRNQLSRARKKNSVPLSPDVIPIQTNDGLLHYAPYRVVIAPSFRFFDTLCVAEQGYANDVLHQEPVYHSVIPNELAKQYDNDRLYPMGLHDDVVISDFYSYISVPLPFETDQSTMNFMVRRVLIRYSKDYACHPKKGSCCLDDVQYFTSCYRIFDKKWEDNDINSDVDVCLITGQPGPNDNGRNEILLSGRIYKSGFQIPICSDQMKNQFLQSCLSRISKMGYETHRLGGSAGNAGATVDQLQYFQKHRGSCPNVNGAVVHIPKDDGTWRAYYISPYKKKEKDMAKVFPYSSPKPGGQVEWTKELDDIYPTFFDQMSKVRSTMSSILIALDTKCSITVSPLSVRVQNVYNSLARMSSEFSPAVVDVDIDKQNPEKCSEKPVQPQCFSKLSKSAISTIREEMSIIASSPRQIKKRSKKCRSKTTKNSSCQKTVTKPTTTTNEVTSSLSEAGTKLQPLDILKRQVVYSFVPYTVGNHQDVTKTGCERELIECKACIQWPAKSVCAGSITSMKALGRGGAGPGMYTVMIVDHPKKNQIN
jgi:hypothetical protein